jgi:hypothetical protein
MTKMSNRTVYSTLAICTEIALLVFTGILLSARTAPAMRGYAIETGGWGGDHIALEVSKKGAKVELDCAHGQIAQAITLDKHGNFDVAGTFTPEHGGPVLRDENSTPTPAHYVGHIRGDTMILTVTLGKEEVGTFTLTRGARPILRKCR